MAGGVDRTGAAVRAQLAGMACALYEVGLLDRARDAMLDRVWDAARVEASIAWLKRQNAGGDDIYIRPRGSVGLLFVDDLAAAAVARLRAEGLAPAVLVESSPGNFQAWVRVAVAPIAPALASAAARELAVRYGGDPQSAAWRHYGRLAGFTNRKPSRRQPNGLPPYALLRHAGGDRAARAADLLRVAEERVKEAEERAAVAPFSGPQGRAVIGLAPAYRRHMERLLTLYPEANPSRLDWVVCKELALAHRNVAPDVLGRALAEAIRVGSPNLAARKARHVDDYIGRTVRAILTDPEIVQVRTAAQARNCAPASSLVT